MGSHTVKGVGKSLNLAYRRGLVVSECKVLVKLLLLCIKIILFLWISRLRPSELSKIHYLYVINKENKKQMSSLML